MTQHAGIFDNSKKAFSVDSQGRLLLIPYVGTSISQNSLKRGAFLPLGAGAGLCGDDFLVISTDDCGRLRVVIGV